MPPSIVVRRATASSRTRKVPEKQATQDTTPNDLAEQLASGLRITDNSKGKQKATPRTAESRRATAMRIVNAALKALSCVAESGWKASAAKGKGRKDVTLEKVKSSCAGAIGALRELREMCAADLDVERAATSACAKLVALETFDLVIDVLRDMQPALVTLYDSTSDSSVASSGHCHLLSLPFPIPASPITDQPLLTVLSTYLLYALTAISHQQLPSELSKFSHTLLDTPTLLAWTPQFRSLPGMHKHTDAVLTRAYNTLTKLAIPETPQSASHTYDVRMYALRLLTHTSLGTIDSCTFWNQTIRFTASFVKSAAVGGEDAAVTTAKTVVAAYGALIDCIAEEEGRQRWRSGKEWVAFCENWMFFAKRAKDVGELDRVGRLLGLAQSPSSHSSSSSKAESSARTGPGRENRDGDESFVVASARICAGFAQATVTLESYMRGDARVDDAVRADVVRRVIDANSLLRRVSLRETSDGGENEARMKVGRSLERLRRIVVKVLESLPGHDDSEMRKSLVGFLTAVIDVVVGGDDKAVGDTADHITAALETLFVLGRTLLDPADPSTYESAYAHLARASLLARAHSATNANWVRCASSAFYLVSGSLYQSGIYGGAVRFLRESCVLGGTALGNRSAEDKAEVKDVDAWKALEEQLYRRWELLSVCYAKIGERKFAFESYIECVRTFPYGPAPVPRIDFNALPSTKHLGSIVEKLTHLGTHELLLGADQVSLKPRLVSAGLEPGVVGGLLEKQLDALEPHLWKEGVREVVKAILVHALEVYQGEMPVRRARVLTRCLEFLYYVGPDSVPTSGWHPEDMGTESARILQCDHFGLDAAQADIVPQLRASIQFWLALHAHRRVDPNQTTLVSQRAEEGCTILRSMLVPPSPSEANSVTRKPAPSKGKAPAARRNIGTTAKVAKNVKTPATPKKTRAPETASLTCASPPRPTVQVQHAVPVEDFDRMLSLLEMVSCLLGLLGLILTKARVLDITRRLCLRNDGLLSDRYITASVDLAHEYFKLGKSKEASATHNHILGIIREGNHGDDVRVKFFLRYAESLAVSDSIRESSGMYCEAADISERMPEEDKTMSSSQRIRTRVGRLARAAVAAQAFALIQYLREDLTISLESTHQALRLWNRAADTLARLRPSQQPSEQVSDTSNPFDTSEATPAANVEATSAEVLIAKNAPTRRASMDRQEWRLAEGLLETLFSLVDLYFTRGSPREACCFAQQAQDLAEALNAPAMTGRALVKKGEIDLSRGRLDEGYANLMLAAKYIQDLPGTDTADIHRLRAEYNRRIDRPEDAQKLYERAMAVVDELDKVFSTFDVHAVSTRKSLGSSPRHLGNQTKKETLLPALLAAVLHQHIWLVRDDPEESAALLEKLRVCSASPKIKVEENALMAKLTFDEVYQRLRADMSLSSIAESVIALPMGMSSDKTIALPPSTQDALAILDDAERLFWADLAFIARTGRVPHVRDDAVSLALIKALQTSLGKRCGAGPALVVGLLDASTTITLRRELLETIHKKFPDPETFDDIGWSAITPDGVPLPRRKLKSSRGFARLNFVRSWDAHLDEDTPDEGETSLMQYWDALRAKYNATEYTLTHLSRSPVTSLLPPHWTVVNITVTEDHSTMFISRQCASKEPLIFCVPIKDRRECADDDGDPHLTFGEALLELEEIVKLSDVGTRQAVNVRNDDAEAKAEWWKGRKQLDRRMKVLLENIEFCWLGAFKTILGPPTSIPQDLLGDLRSALEQVFRRALRSQKQAQSIRMSLDDSLIECFSALSPNCRTEELEDIIYFILDMYQFRGIPVAIAEVDISLVTVELQMVLESHAVKAKPHVREVEDSHLFLILGRNVQAFPWESIPILRGRSVSRIPNMDFLVDRLQLASCQTGGGVKSDRTVVNPKRVSYILNPSGDLKGTEERFRSWLKEMHSVGWDGVVGKPPSEQQFADMLSRRDLVIYFGHGGAEQYIRSHKLRSLPRCAATMLWGCSSGVLRDMGDFDRVGTPYNYMLAGCPTLVANIWDVTDRDIDKFAQSVHEKLRLTSTAGGTRAGHKDPMSVVTAIAHSRDVCKLKYLTGAAPVIYGIPFYL